MLGGVLWPGATQSANQRHAKRGHSNLVTQTWSLKPGHSSGSWRSKSTVSETLSRAVGIMSVGTLRLNQGLGPSRLQGPARPLEAVCSRPAERATRNEFDGVGLKARQRADTANFSLYDGRNERQS